MSRTKHLHRSDEEWMKIIQTCRTSGLTDAAWCQQNGLPRSSFYSAVERLRKDACSIPAKITCNYPELQEVVPITFDNATSTYHMMDDQGQTEISTCYPIQIVVNEYKIQMSNNCGKEIIRNTLLALREIC